MTKYRKKPVVIEAVQWWKHGDHPAVEKYGESVVDHMPAFGACGFIKTLESAIGSNHHVIPGDWIITGVKGEHYACKADIFALTYEPESTPPEERAKLPSLPEEIQEWCWHMDLHLTEHDDRHAAMALRAAWPQVSAWLKANVSPSKGGQAFVSPQRFSEEKK